MFTSILQKPNLYNKELSEYCLRSTKDSLKRIVKGENKFLGSNLVEKEFHSDDNPNNNNYAGFLFYFLSISSFAYYLYKRN